MKVCAVVVLIVNLVCLVSGITVEKDLSLTLSQKNALDKVICHNLDFFRLSGISSGSFSY